MPSKRFQKLLKEARQGDDYWIAEAQIEFTEQLHELMERRGLSRSELARIIGKSPAYITKALGGSTNFTLATMVRLARALDGHVHLKVCAQEDRSKWFHVIGIHPTRSALPQQKFKEVDIPLNDNQFDKANNDEFIPATA